MSRNRGQYLLPPSSNYGMFGDPPIRPIPRSRWGAFRDRFETPIRWGGFLLPLVISLIALVITLDTRGRLPTTAVLPSPATPTALASPTPGPTDTLMPTATPVVGLIPLPPFPAGVCQGAVRSSVNAVYRRAPSMDADVLGVFVPFQRLNIMGKSGNFDLVVVGQFSGWMPEFLIQFDDPDCVSKLPPPTP